jgi:hypothetical protein
VGHGHVGVRPRQRHQQQEPLARAGPQQPDQEVVTLQGHDDVLDVAVGGQFTGHQGQYVDHIGRPGRRDRQPHVVLLLQRAQDHAAGGIHQARVDEAIDLPHRIEYQLSRKRGHDSSLPR